MKKFREIANRHSELLGVLLLCGLAYGLLIPWLGFYWDDWPLAWIAHQFGAEAFFDFAAYRPASGGLYWLSFSLLGENVLAWQLYALAWRIASVLAFAWLLRLIWPRQKGLAAAAALAFAVYPGFSQQPIAVVYSLYFLYYTSFLVSLACMVLAARRPERRLAYTALSLALAGLVGFSTEYFYGLELLRPLILWLVLEGSGRQRIRRALRAWAPYLLLVLGLFAWRYQQSTQPGSLYDAALLHSFRSDPLGAAGRFMVTAIGDWLEALVLAWGRALQALDKLDIGSLAGLAYVGVLAAAGGAAWWVLAREQDEDQGDATAELRGALGLGLAALLVGGLSFWVAEQPFRLAFAWDRFSLPLMFGSCLALAVAWSGWRAAPRAKALLLAGLLALAAGYHFDSANGYREEWEQQQAMLQQLTWRAPDLADNTALISPEITALPHYTDNSLAAVINWMYAAPGELERLPYAYFYAGLRAESGLGGLVEGREIRQTYRFLDYSGDASKVLVFYFAPPACLRVLDPEIDGLNPEVPESIDQYVPLSNLDLIQAEGVAGQGLPHVDFGAQQSWCYYFQRAEMARQQGDWAQVVQLGERAFALDDSPNAATERAPFIEGYAHRGDWARAEELTAETLRIHPDSGEYLCALWARIEREMGAGERSAAKVGRVEEMLGCEGDGEG